MKKIIVFLLLFLFIPFAFALTIDSNSIIHASGQSIGIKVDSGVVIKKTYDIKDGNNTYKPWEGILKSGDKIIEFNDIKINNLKDMLQALQKSNKEALITYVRDGKIYKSSISVITKSNGMKTIGLLLKDGVMGVGTLTYVLDDKSYGALGHQISSEEIKGGSIFESKVSSINKSKERDIGEKNVEIEDYRIGEVLKNTKTGIYGTASNNYESRDYKVGFKEEVKKGKATILTTITGKEIEEFDIEILEAYNQNDVNVKSMKVKVVDKRLIEKTGGIIQGMSGSPIIQNNKIIGALTHVIVDNPLEGYGIYIEWMLKDNGVEVKK